MDPAPIAVSIVSIIAARSCGFLGLWVRLRAQARREQNQSLDVSDIAEAVAVSGRLVLDEQWIDGHRRHLEITSSRVAEEGKAR